MCGIVGIVGNREAVPVLIEGLKRLEYRGYDSAGLAVFDDTNTLHLRRSMGRLSALELVLDDAPVSGSCGIGHTRWATHGPPSVRNCHPHLDASGAVALVHNGIIENDQALKRAMMAEGIAFASDTDTEVLTNLIARHAVQAPTFLDGFRAALREARGAYALGVLNAAEPGVLYAARLGSPLIIGMGRGANFIASDVPAILSKVRKVIYLDDGEVARITADQVEVFRLDGTPVELLPMEVDLKEEEVDKAGFETFMLKEIHEQTRVLRGLIDSYVDANDRILLPDLRMDDEQVRALERIMIVSCGTAYYAAMYGRLLIEQLTSIAVEVDLGSEFRYRSPKITPRTLVAAVSQSGETADTLASIKMARTMGCRILSICNVAGSSLVRESDHLIFTCAGREIGVASTKAFTAQLMAFVLFALHAARVRGELDEARARTVLSELRRIPNAIHYVLERRELIKAVADKHYEGPSALYLGRRFNYPIALEGALKNKEISYQHAEGYAAGEMKHGPIALISNNLPVVCLCTDTADEVVDKMLSNVREVQARKGRIIALATDGDTRLNGLAEDILFVPRTLEELSPLVNVVALQLLAYYAAQARGTDIDQPRNLAKSVTVE